MGFYVRLWRLVALAGLALCWSGTARAQVGVPGSIIPVCIAPAAAGMAARALFASPARFDCVTPQTAFGKGDYWVLSAPLPAGSGAGRALAVRTASLWQVRRTLYALYADGAIVALRTDDHAASRHLQLGAIAQSVLPVRGVEARRLLWHVEGSVNLRGVVNGVQIATLAQAAKANLLLAAMYSAFAGLCIALLVYNLALWGAMRHRFQLLYCGMVVTLMIYAFSSSGALAWAFPGIANTDRMRINYLTLGVAAATALAFARSFFEERIFEGWLGRVSAVVFWTAVTMSVAYSALAPWHAEVLDKLYALSLLALVMAVVPILWRAWRRRSNYLWLFALSWTAPVVVALLRVANGLHSVTWSFWLDNSTILSMSLEALLSSLAIAYRIRLLSLDRDNARAEEIAAKVLADTDPLTGLLNRRAFLRNAIGRDEEQLLLIADIDHFKRVNETIGHDGGDEVLRVFARTLRASVPTEAIVARLGGEEFAILTPATHPVGAEAILARLRAARMPFDLRVTASIGLCRGVLTTEADWKALYRCGDRALFEAKAAGRDRAREGLRTAA